MAFYVKILLGGIIIYSNELVCNILTYIKNNINAEITISDISNLFSYDKTYIMKKFKKELGITIKEYINIIKVLNSLTYYNSNNTILKIAILSGYNSIEYYSEVFSKLIGVSPRVYKKFIMPLSNLSEKEIQIIRTSISELYSLKDKITKYLNNQKPKKLPTRKISIFN